MALFKVRSSRSVDPERQANRRAGGVLRLPKKGSPLQDYARHYAGVTEGDRRIVVSVFVIPGGIMRRPEYTSGVKQLSFP